MDEWCRSEVWSSGLRVQGKAGRVCCVWKVRQTFVIACLVMRSNSNSQMWKVQSNSKALGSQHSGQSQMNVEKRFKVKPWLEFGQSRPLRYLRIHHRGTDSASYPEPRLHTGAISRNINRNFV